MGQHASLSVVEDAVRAVEGGVLSDLSQDAALRNRVIKLRSTSTEVVFEQERVRSATHLLATPRIAIDSPRPRQFRWALSE